MIEPDRTQVLELIARAAANVVNSRDHGPTGGTDLVSWDAMEHLSYWVAMLKLLPKPSDRPQPVQQTFYFERQLDT